MREKLRAMLMTMMMMIAEKNSIWFTFPSHSLSHMLDARVSKYEFNDKAHSKILHTGKCPSLIAQIYNVYIE